MEYGQLPPETVHYKVQKSASIFHPQAPQAMRLSAPRTMKRIA